MEADGIVDHARKIGEQVLGPALREVGARHTAVGEVRGNGAMWVVELVEDLRTRQPWSAERMKERHAACRAEGTWPLVMGNRVHMVPPCVITAEEAVDGVEALDGALTAVGA